ncbi:MAG: hypothetical protein EH225_04290 [Calditrichaeota bacterium]|nr:hypothetical protein [Calditrichota bacterium]RQW05804.1 MAG: hypothetical protein EH225_04290 [Calditrichota bacterium]
MKYHHLGIPTQKVHEKETYLEHYKFFCTDHTSNPYGIQWMRFEPDSPLPDIVKTVPHVAFEVDDLAVAIEGKNIIIQPNSPSDGVMVAFILEAGAPVEFIQFIH